jgi:hypothetical protein
MPDLVAFLVAAGPLALMVTQTVDMLLNAGLNVPSWMKNALAFIVGVGYCLLFGVNLMGTIAFRPEVAARLEGVWGEVITGLAIGAVAGFWDRHLDAKAAEATANTTVATSQ